MTIDWNRYGPAIVWTLTAGIIAALARGQGSRLIHLLFRAESGRALESIMDALESREGRVRLKAHVIDLFGPEMQEREAQQAEAMQYAHQALDIAQTNKTSLEAVAEIQKLQGASLNRVQEQVQNIPRMTDILQQLTHSTESISKEMQGINQWMARMDEREKMREQQERRWHDENPHPHRRQGD